jgi:hypothetical protein
MLPIVACSHSFVQFVTILCQEGFTCADEAWQQYGEFRHPACAAATADGIIIGGHAAARATVGHNG